MHPHPFFFRQYGVTWKPAPDLFLLQSQFKDLIKLPVFLSLPARSPSPPSVFSRLDVSYFRPIKGVIVPLTGFFFSSEPLRCRLISAGSVFSALFGTFPPPPIFLDNPFGATCAFFRTATQTRCLPLIFVGVPPVY